MHQQKTAFENIVGKGEIARYEQFLLFPQCFLLYQIIVSPFAHIFYILSLFAGELGEPKIGISVKGLTLYKTNKISDWFKLKDFADDKMNVTQKLNLILGRE